MAAHIVVLGAEQIDEMRHRRPRRSCAANAWPGREPPPCRRRRPGRGWEVPAHQCPPTPPPPGRRRRCNPAAASSTAGSPASIRRPMSPRILIAICCKSFLSLFKASIKIGTAVLLIFGNEDAAVCRTSTSLSPRALTRAGATFSGSASMRPRVYAALRRTSGAVSVIALSTIGVALLAGGPTNARPQMA